MKITYAFSALILVGLLFIASCENDKHNPPTITFKTDTGYTFADGSVSKGASIKVGIKATKTEDDLKTFNVSYAYDGATSTTTQDNFTLTADQAASYEKDYTFTVRNQAGVEQWSFVITDKDGNIAKLSIKLTVN